MARKITINFPDRNMDGEPRAKARYASKRANGTINTHPKERMEHSSQRKET